MDETRARGGVPAGTPPGEQGEPIAGVAARRVVVAGVTPCVEGGRYPIKRLLDEEVVVQADLVADSHDVLAGRVLYRHGERDAWQSAPLVLVGEDRYLGTFRVDCLGRWQYTVEGWVDALASFRRELGRRLQGSDQADVAMSLRHAASIVRACGERVEAAERARFVEAAARLEAADRDLQAALDAVLDDALLTAAEQHPDPTRVSRAARVFEVVVEPARAGFGAWYEFFPRSARDDGAHARLRDCEGRLRYAAAMGFDVVYLPPIHPIGRSYRKGKDNHPTARAGDPGSPWAIGAAEGGHKQVHPELGTLEDFRWLVARARELGLAVALDIALQVSPDHPYVREHPEWFVRRPDGSIQHAENPPKKYQDIYPFDFQCQDAPALWRELQSIFEHWIAQGVTIFRVDNPHTKSLAFWEHCLRELKREHPHVIFLAEAFTRPKLMYALAKLGFSQSYTYFTWRATKRELTEYFTELTQTELAEYFRPSLWPNTPDILPEQLQYGGRPAFIARVVLAATLGGNYGVYGPAFELMESAARDDSGEYRDNEKYEIKRWNIERPDSLSPLLTRLNAIRRDNPALHGDRSLLFHPTDNEMLLCYSKHAGDNVIVVVVNLDVHHVQSGFIELDLAGLGIAQGGAYQAHDLLTGARFLWTSARNYVELDPQASPAHVLRIRHRLRSEHDFDYFE